MNIKLTFEAPSTVFFKGRDVFRLRCVASDAVDMPNEIFLHQKTTIDPVTEETQDEFCAICGPYELSNYPANTPDPEQVPTFFRKSVVDILLPSSENYEEVKASIIDQVRSLIEAQTRLDLLVTEDVVWIPEAP